MSVFFEVAVTVPGPGTNEAEGTVPENDQYVAPLGRKEGFVRLMLTVEELAGVAESMIVTTTVVGLLTTVEEAVTVPLTEVGESFLTLRFVVSIVTVIVCANADADERSSTTRATDQFRIESILGL